MVYRKKSFKRKSYSRSSNYLSTAGRALSVATAALHTAKLVKSLVNTEFKTRQQGPTLYNVGTVGQEQCVTTVAQGNDVDERSGNSVKVKSIQIRGNFKWNNLGAAIQRTRLIFFTMPGCNGAEPTWQTELLDSASVDSFYNTDYGRQYRVLYDKTFTLSEQRPAANLKWGKYNMNQHVEYIGTSASITSQGSNAIFYALLSDEATNKPTLYLTTRTRYIDN